MSKTGEWGAVKAAEEAADIAIASAQIAVKAGNKAVAAVPIPDPREHVNFQRLAGLGEQQSFLARISPRRNRWPELVEIDERVADLDRRQEELRGELAGLRDRRDRADEDHAARLAAWLAGGKQEPRPLSEVRELEEAIVEVSAEFGAIDSLRERVLEERIAFVAKHRKRLVKDAERAIDVVRKRYLELVAELEQVREELIGLNESRLWAELFPSELLATYAPAVELVGGRRQVTLRHMHFAKQGIPANGTFALLRADAEHFATVATLDQKAAIEGVSTAELTGDGASWAGSDADLAQKKREKERIIAAGGRTTVDALKHLEAERFGR